MLETLQKKGCLIMEKNHLHGDNQQLSLEAKLGWFGGIMDGEGSIILPKHCNANTFYPVFRMGNTNYKLCKMFVDILRELNIPFYVRYDKPTKTKYKPMWRIIITGMKRVKKILEIINPYLISKREQGELILEFINSRLDMNSNRSSASNKPLTNYQIGLANKVNLLNKVGFQKNSTTTRQAQLIKL